MPNNPESIINLIKNELNIASKALSEMSERIDHSVAEAVEILYNCKGKVVVTGMGKTGLIGRKISATLASTGTTSIFLHAAEGIHGDLGILHKDDVIIAISYSGNSDELISIIPFMKFLKLPIIAITGNPDSKLANAAEIVIDTNINSDLEPFGLVPTISTTSILAVGDALAVALLERRNFTKEDFAKFHPGGAIGKRLLLRVRDLMHTGEDNPRVLENATMKEVIIEMTAGKNLGCTSVVDENDILIGFVTDGDLRRLLMKSGDPVSRPVSDCMTVNPKSATPEMLAVEAINLMEDHKITMLPVIDGNCKVVGLLHMHDLINAGVVG